MWTRKELKDKARSSFKANYWKAVLIGLVVAMLVGGLGVMTSSAGLRTSLVSRAGMVSQIDDCTNTAVTATTDNLGAATTTDKTIVNIADRDGSVQIGTTSDGGMVIDVGDDQGTVHLDLDEGTIGDIAMSSIAAMVMLGLFLAFIALVAAVFAFVLYVFLLSPLEVGASRFFLRNLDVRSEVKELAYAYDNCYKETVKTLFLRSLFIFLWSLLFVIPGIYKMYQYRMIPYLLADDPSMTKDRAFAESKSMMDGQKWRAFVLDLSFIGWHILSALTLGILGVFYVVPYQSQTNAALYRKLRYHEPSAEMPVANAPVAYAAEPPIPPFAAAGAQPAQQVQPMQEAQATQPAQQVQSVLPAQAIQPTQQDRLASSPADDSPTDTIPQPGMRSSTTASEDTASKDTPSAD